ncbi:MAG: amino acid permease [Actinomycetia bacterium]|nr:amino acid permease [Actinomycetes bacterium]
MSATATQRPTPTKQRSYLGVFTLAMLAAAAMVTSLRGLSMLAKVELTMFVYIAFAVIVFLIPAALVAAELGGAFTKSKGGVYEWIGEAFGQRWGFLAIWLQWIQNVVWYPVGLAFAAAAAAFAIQKPELAGNHIYVGLFCIIVYWLATFIALAGTKIFAKVAKFGFILGTAVPGILLLGLFVYWVVSGNQPAWDATDAPAVADGFDSPRFFPQITGLSNIAFLAGILLLFAGVEVQAVHVKELKKPKSQFPAAMLIAAVVAVVIFALGTLAVAGMVPYDKIDLTTGVFDAFQNAFTALGVGAWAISIVSIFVCFGAIAGVLAWITGPSKGLLETAEDGLLPPWLQKTNKRGIQLHILWVQGGIVTLISTVYFFIDNVSVAFFLITVMAISVYIIMYLFMFAAGIRLRYSHPELPRSFKIPLGNAGMWMVAGLGFIGMAFALVLSFVPPSQLPVGSPALYIGLVSAGTIIFVGLPLIIHARRKPSWLVKPKPETEEQAT